MPAISVLKFSLHKQSQEILFDPMNRVLDDFMEKNLQPEPEIEDEEIEVYKEVANLADDLRLTVLELEKEGKIDRSTLLEYIQPDTIMFYRETFSHFPHSERSAFAGKKEVNYPRNKIIRKK